MGWLNILNQNGVGTVMVFPLASALPAGKWYWEVRFANAGAKNAAFRTTARIGVFDGIKPLGGDIGDAPGSFAWRADGTAWNAGVSRPMGSSPTENDDTAMIAVDIDSRRIWFGLNGAWFEGDPASARAPALSDLPGLVTPAVSCTHGVLGTLHQYVPTEVADFRWPPPRAFERFVPGKSEFLPRPILFQAKPSDSILARARRLIANAVDFAKSGGGGIGADRKARGTFYRNLAKDFFDKGNIVIAEKVAMQAEACDPSNAETREMIAWFSATLMHLVEIANGLKQGDYGEFGVSRGMSAKIIHSVMDRNRRLYLFDTFEGFYVDDIEPREICSPRMSSQK
ncbi:MAG: SPRY domain-containing protein [Rhodospirillales bacterium]